jgi:PPOX class probable F420-dependent enzyme
VRPRAGEAGYIGVMTKPPVPAELDDFLSRPNPSVIATLTPRGAPHTAATWYVWDDGRVLVNMAADRKRLDHVRRDPRVSLTVMGQGEDWYRQLTLRGRVGAIEDDPELEGIDRLSRHYTGEPYARRRQQRVNAWIEVESWYGWSGGAAWTGRG